MDRSDRQDRRRQGKSDPLDAVSAARAAQSGRARGAPKGRDGAGEAIRALMVARRSAAGERTRTNGQARALILTGPDDLRARFTRHTRPPWSPGSPRCGPAPATSRAMPSASRCGNWDGAPSSWTASSAAWTISSSPWSPPAPRACSPCTGSARAPRRCCSSRPGITPDGSAPRRPGRTCAAPPRSPASSGKVTRHRLNPGGDRQDCHALWRIVFTRLGSDPATRAYAERRTAEGKSKAEIIRCLKRYVAREVYRHLRPAAANARKLRGRPDPIFGCREPAGLRTIRRPSPASPDLLGVT